jgi:hypothetical protein
MADATLYSDEAYECAEVSRSPDETGIWAVHFRARDGRAFTFLSQSDPNLVVGRFYFINGIARSPQDLKKGK